MKNNLFILFVLSLSFLFSEQREFVFKEFKESGRIDGLVDDVSNQMYLIELDIKSDSHYTEIIIEDDGEGYPRDVLSKIGEPYIKSFKSSVKSQSGLGLGIFIGKTLLEKNYANILCKNSKTKSGAEVSIKWKNKDLLSI